MAKGSHNCANKVFGHHNGMEDVWQGCGDTYVGVGRFALHIFCLRFGALLPPPPQMMPMLISLQTRVSALHFRRWQYVSITLLSFKF